MTDFRPQLIHDAAKYVIVHRRSSVADLGRRFHIGQRKAVDLLNVLEAHEVVGPALIGQARDILVDRTQLRKVLASLPALDDTTPAGDEQ